MSAIKKEPEKLSDLLKKRTSKKPPAHEWQDLALRVIKELNIPTNKRSSVFRVCKTFPKKFVEMCMNDTKELAGKDKWRYFFKLVNQNSED